MRPTGFSWITFNQRRGDKASADFGGVVEVFTAASTLNTGDCVFLSAANTVDKSLTATNYVGFVGVVVGGQRTNDNLTTAVGVQAATVGQRVLVQISGIANVVAGGTITAGTNFSVIPDSAGTAGRVVAGTTAGQVLGKALTTATAGNPLKLLISHR